MMSMMVILLFYKSAKHQGTKPLSTKQMSGGLDCVSWS